MIARDESDLFRLVYRSRAVAADAGGGDGIEAILAAARRWNAEAGITGILLYARPYFVQALEGPAGAVEAAFDRICCDLRHDTIEVVECGPAIERSFGDWSMDYVDPDPGTGAALGRIADGTELADVAAVTIRLLSSLMRSRPAAVDRAAARP